MRRFVIGLALALGLSLAAGPFTVASAGDKTDKKTKQHAAKDRKPRSKAEIEKGCKAELEQAKAREAKLKSQVASLEAKCKGHEEAAAKCAALDKEWHEFEAAMNALLVVAVLDEIAFEAAIDAMNTELAEFYADLEAMEAYEESIDGLHAIIIGCDAVLVDVVDIVIDLDDYCDELDGTVGDDVDDVIVIIVVDEG